MEQKSIAEKLEIVTKWGEENWSASQASKEVGIPRSTLIGWANMTEKLSTTSVDPFSKRVSKPGLQAPTAEFEKEIASMIQAFYDFGDPMTRSDIISVCVDRIPGFHSRRESAQSSWLSRFIKRWKLEPFIIRAKRRSTSSRISLTESVTLPPVDSDTSVATDRTTKPLLPIIPKKSAKMARFTETSTSTIPENPAISVQLLEMPGSKILQQSLPAEGSRNDPIDPIEDSVDSDTWEYGIVDGGGQIICRTKSVCFVPNMPERVIAVQERDMNTLQPKMWLNDVVLSFYIREHIPAYGSTFNFDCQFFRQILIQYKIAKKNAIVAHKNSGGITGTFPWQDYRHIMVPVWMENHWSFVIVQNPVNAFPDLARFLVHVDSLSLHPTQTITEILLAYFREESRVKFGLTVPSKLTNKRIQTSPRQMNGYDCGVFVLYFMKRVNMALLADPELPLWSSINNICTVNRKDFNPSTFRTSIRENLKDA